MSSYVVGASSIVEMTEVDVCQEHLIHPEHVIVVRQSRLTTNDATKAASLFAILSDPTRLQVVHALYHAPTGELCVCDLASGLGRDDTTISHQLRILRNHRLVSARKVGRVVYYRLTDQHIRQLLELSMAHLYEQELPAPFLESESNEELA